MKILLVEDSAVERSKLGSLLADWGFDFVGVGNGAEAIKVLDAPNAPDLALLDWIMPGLDGIDVLRRIRMLNHGNYIYTVMLTAKTRKQDRMTAMEVGADDFLSKPIDAAELRSRIMVGKRILELQQSLRFAATHDFLTNLLNRSEILASLDRELARSGREGTPMTIILADIDHFKRVNDTLGHAAGDEVLKEVARRLKTDLRPYDLVGRYGGEEFLIILPGCHQTAGLRRANQVRKKVEESPIPTQFGTASATVSMGLSVTSSRRECSLQEFLREADMSLYRAKENGRNRVEAFAPLVTPAGAGS